MPPEPLPIRIGLRQAALALLGALALALLGEAIQAQVATRERCLLDRLPIQPIYQVRVNQPDGQSLHFGSPRCALSYLERLGTLRDLEVIVTDEVAGRPVPARQAFFVQSEVLTSRQDGNDWHVFADEVEARRHAMRYEGQLLPDPFARWEQEAPAPLPPAAPYAAPVVPGAPGAPASPTAQPGAASGEP
ncbi:MAG: hypothetical protein RBU45_03835 [Myxococcota bacterium]|jgi:hypothetical protein|nr:hypothetical protein [Myxococcota bacterium]